MDNINNGNDISNEVHKMAGKKLKKACQKFKESSSGFVGTTAAYNLPNKHVFHMVLDPYEKDSPGFLTKLVLGQAKYLDLKTLTIQCQYDRRSSKRILDNVREELESDYQWQKIILCCNENPDIHAWYEKLMPTYFPTKKTKTAFIKPVESSSESSSSESEYSSDYSSDY